MRGAMIRGIDGWERVHDSAVRAAQLSRLQERQLRLPVESLEWPPPQAATLREQIIGLCLIFQIIWWAVTGKLFRAM